MTIASLSDVVHSLDGSLEPEPRAWLQDAIAAIAADPAAVRTRFPMVGRKVGRAPEVADWARALLLATLGEHVRDELPDLYRYGDAAERRALLRSLHLLPMGETGMAYVHDALRTNDPRLVIAALGPYALERLNDDELGQAVLKCVFMGLPLAAVDGLEARTTPDLARMLASFVHERVAAGRSVPADVWSLIDLYPPADELAAIAAELESPVEDRRRAAAQALERRTAS